MPEGIVTPDGKPVDVETAEKAEQIDRDFAKIMSDPDAGNEKAPPRRAAKPQDPPRGQDKPRVTRSPGRPRKDATDPKKTTPAVSREDRVTAVRGLVQLTSTGLVLASNRAKNGIPFAADAVVLASNADPLAEAVADTCAQDPRFAALVDKIATAGPYAALVTVTVGIGIQVARNHGVPVPGTHAPEDIVKAATEPDMAAAA